ncbi:MAG TPA: hypothetical protein PK788_06770 [Gemmatimonadaceae bacterium]|nr:hypothetical protein [Gemmatimonadaceae bacterium]
MLRALLALLLVALPLSAQHHWDNPLRDDAKFSFYDRGPYRQDVPRPESILGFNVGSYHTQYHLQACCSPSPSPPRTACASRRSA